MPCRAFLLQLQEHIDTIRELGAEPLGISVAADFQAAHLMEHSVDFDLLLDPDRNFKTEALAVPKVKLWTYLTPKATKRYLRGARYARQGLPTAMLTEPPGVAIITTDGEVRYLYSGETLGDYPPIDVVLDELRSI